MAKKKTTKKTTTKKTARKASATKKTARKASATKKTARKASATKKSAKPKPIEIPQDLLDRLLELVVMEGKTFDEAERELSSKWDQVVVAAASVEVSTRISSVAKFDRVEEIGAGIMRLRSIFAAAKLAGELTAAISAQTQIGKLLALYPKAGETGGGESGDTGSEAASELEAIAEHLRPLGLASPDYPLSGLARITADRIRQLEAKG